MHLEFQKMFHLPKYVKKSVYCYCGIVEPNLEINVP